MHHGVNSTSEGTRQAYAINHAGESKKLRAVRSPGLIRWAGNLLSFKVAQSLRKATALIRGRIQLSASREVNPNSKPFSHLTHVMMEQRGSSIDLRYFCVLKVAPIRRQVICVFPFLIWTLHIMQWSRSGSTEFILKIPINLNNAQIEFIFLFTTLSFNLTSCSSKYTPSRAIASSPLLK
ncbi:unnamed protein product [Somion occarium]|uniref:Uncharacterized protein n=1 Tax=Somion occarium TaxID=3059160 RepID=A0ABP1CUF6_9APHY